MCLGDIRVAVAPVMSDEGNKMNVEILIPVVMNARRARAGGEVAPLPNSRRGKGGESLARFPRPKRPGFVPGVTTPRNRAGFAQTGGCSLSTLYHRFTTEAWAILASAAEAWSERFSYQVPAGAQQDDARDFLGNTKPKLSWQGSTAIVPVCGPIIANAGFAEIGFGATSHGIIGNDLKAAIDGGATLVILDCDSPGGTVRGTAELADAIYSARQKTQVVAYVGGMCASACYWLASSTSKIYGTATSQTGARGAIMQTASIARMLSEAGVDVETFLSAGAGTKAAGNSLKVMTPPSAPPYRRLLTGPGRCSPRPWPAIARRCQPTAMPGLCSMAGTPSPPDSLTASCLELTT